MNYFDDINACECNLQHYCLSLVCLYAKMFSDFGVKTCNKFIGSCEYRALPNKHERIRHVLAHFDLNKLVKAAVKTTLEHSQKGRKNSEVSRHHLKIAKTLFASTRNVNQQLEKAVENASKALLYAHYGSDEFVEAMQLRGKCFIRLAAFEQAILDTEMALTYGGFSPERALLKAICLHSRNQFIPLKNYLRLIKDKVEDFQDEPLLEELGQTHLSFSHLFSFVSDPNFNQQTSRPTDLLSNPPVLFYIESLTSYKAIYELDPRCKIANDDYKGRHFMATEDISKGSTLLVERSYSLVFDRQSQLEHCLFCQKTVKGGIPCTQCSEVIFCSELCSQRAWDHFHGHECTLLSMFKDSYNVSLHMYRTIAAIGHRQALAVQEEFQKQLSKVQQTSGNKKDKSAAKVLHEATIDDFLGDESLRTTAHYRQDSEQRLKMYRMNQALIDHNHMYEDYYDICYMGVSIDVALLLFLKAMITEEKSAISDGNEEKEVLWDRLKHLKFDHFHGLKGMQNEQTHFLSGTLGEYMTLIGIIQLNIRKLVTNVFSWNIYDDSYQVKKSVATCQCLVGSFINHSCDPSVEWDFRNGCIVYTATRDIAAGTEINNSYGPHSSTEFIERQNLLSSNYYFNCRCELCKKEAANFKHVLGCFQCNGPVVCTTESIISANCMDCLVEYPDVQYRMKRVNTHRAIFKRLLHFFADLPNGSTLSEELEPRFNELLESMDYQLTYTYAKSDLLQGNLQTLCRLLVRLGKFIQAAEYGQYQLTEKPTLSKSSDETVSSVLDKLESSIFWFQLYYSYLKQCFKQGNTPDFSKMLTFATSSDVVSLVTIAQNLLEHHYGLIQQSTVRLAKCYESQMPNRSNTSGEEAKEEENGEEDLLDIGTFSNSDLLGDEEESGENGVLVTSMPSSVKRLLSDVIQQCSTQYYNCSTY